MLINKIPSSSNVELQYSVEGYPPLTFSIESVTGSVSKSRIPCLYCTPVLMQGKLVKLKDGKITAYILNRGDHRRYCFAIDEAVHVRNPRVEGNLICLQSQTDARPLNYRRATRIKCSAECSILYDGTIAPIKAQIYDISTCGIGIIVDSESVPVIGNTAQINFTMMEYGMSYNLRAVVVRLYNLSETSVLVGCDLTDYYPNLVALCNTLKAASKPNK